VRAQWSWLISRWEARHCGDGFVEIDFNRRVYTHNTLHIRKTVTTSEPSVLYFLGYFILHYLLLKLVPIGAISIKKKKMVA
jgi:hypothetical protein